MGTKSWSLSKEVKEEMKLWRQDGHSLGQIAQWFGVTKTSVRNIVDAPKSRSIQKKYYLKHRERLIKRMKEYNQERKNR